MGIYEQQTINAASAALGKGDLAQVNALCSPLLEDVEHRDAAKGLLARAHFLDATRWFTQKKWRLADLRCRIALGLDDSLAEAYQMLGTIAWNCGMPRFSSPYFGSALRLRPDWPMAADAAQRAEAAFAKLPKAAQLSPEPPEGAAERFLVIKAWGAGFFSEVHHVTNHCLLAELTGRTPLVDWGEGCLFAEQGREGFEHFFEPLSAAKLDALPTGEGELFPPKWRADNLTSGNNDAWNGPFSRQGPIDLMGRSEPVVVSDFYCWTSELKPWIPADHWLHGKSNFEINRDLGRKYLRFSPDMVRRAEAFIAKHLPDPYVAVHIRGSDKVDERGDLDAVNQHNQTLIAETMERYAGHKLFVMTDSEADLERLQEQYGNRVVSASATRTRGQIGVHFLKDQNKLALGEEVLLDVMLALKADHFIGNAYSNISRFISEYRDWDGQLDLIGHYDHEKLDEPWYMLTVPH